MKRVDQNQKEIVDALRAVGCLILDLTAVGNGCPDLLVARHDTLYLLEIKNPGTKGKLNARQQKWHDEWKGQVAIASTVDEAFAIVGIKAND